MSKPKLYTDFDGRRTALRDLVKAPTAIENGISYPMIYKRYRYEGLRGVDLIAPRPKSARLARTERAALTERAELRRQAKARKAEREERYITALIKAREAHERELSRPLISAKLLTDEERWQHRFKVVGVQRWTQMGGWRGQ